MRVLVTRAEADAVRTAAALAALGHEAVSAPVMRIVPATITASTHDVDAVLATSAHAFLHASTRDDVLCRLPLFAVGQTTAVAARKAGYKDIRVGHGAAADLATLLSLTLPRPAHVLFLAGRDRKPDVETTLMRAGYTLSVVEAYAAEAETRWPEDARQALAQGRIAAALHYSGRSAVLALDLAARHDLEAAFLALPHLCLSDDVAEPIRHAGARRVLVAAEPNEAALLARLAEVR